MGPRRRCVGCGRTAPKRELLRLVAVTAEPERRSTATIDRAGTLPGRGAYLCRAGGVQEAPKHECLRAATRKGGLSRALRRAIELSPELIEAGSLDSESR